MTDQRSTEEPRTALYRGPPGGDSEDDKEVRETRYEAHDTHSIASAFRRGAKTFLPQVADSCGG
jgi:hypothetical protein